MSAELKPCPFCGSRNVNDTTPPPDQDEYENKIYYWVCPDCVACGPVTETLESCTEAWNTRTSLKEELIEKINNLKCDKKLSLVDLGLDKAIEAIKEVIE